MEKKQDAESYESDFEDEDDESDAKDTRMYKEHKAEENWKSIAFEELEVGSQIGGGGVGLVYQGMYHGQAVALKTLVRLKRYIEGGSI